MKLAIITVTKKGVEKALFLKEKIGGDIYALTKYSVKGTIAMEDGFKNCVKTIFNSYDTHLFVMASGIVVRTIAPLIKTKDIDPGVLVMDENSNFVSSLLSGHLGGANEATSKIAQLVDAIPVISTASDVSGKIAVDTMAMKLNSSIESLEDAKNVTSLIVADEKVDIKVPKNIDCHNPSGVILVSNRKNIEISKIIPKNLVVGIGCRRDTKIEVMERVLYGLFKHLNLEIKAIRKFATVDIKKDEKAILYIADKFNKNVDIIDRKEIAKIEDDFVCSDFVRKTIGVGAVSGPVAKISSNRKGKFLVEKHMEDGITVSIYEERTEKV